MQGCYRDDSATFLQSPLESCIADIYVWCGAKHLQLNADKTEPLCVIHSSTVDDSQFVVKPVTVV